MIGRDVTTRDRQTRTDEVMKKKKNLIVCFIPDDSGAPLLDDGTHDRTFPSKTNFPRFLVSLSIEKGRRKKGRERKEGRDTKRHGPS